MIIKLTPADILKGKLLDAGWYSAKVVKCGDDWVKAKSDPNSANWLVTFEIQNTGGKEIDVSFSSKALGFLTPFISAVRGKEVPPEHLAFETTEVKGKMVDVQIIQDTYQGMMNNKITAYLPAGKGKSAQTY